MIGALSHWWQRHRAPRGLALPRSKPAIEAFMESPAAAPLIRTIAAPSHLVLPLVDYHGNPLEAVVNIGDQKMRGQPVADGVLCSLDAVVTGIERRTLCHPSGRSAECVILRTQSNESASDEYPPSTAATLAPGKRPPPTNDRASADRALDIATLQSLGVTGLGGAGFPTATKLSAINDRRPVTLIVNAVECEPQISCDEALMLSEADGIVAGIDQLIQLTRCSRCVLAVEDDKREALAALQAAMQLRHGSNTIPIELHPLSPIYPSGAEVVLIARLTGVRLQQGERPAQHGIVCVNVATTLAVQKATRGEPLTSRIVTLTGNQVQQPMNIEVPFGTSVAHVLNQTGNQHAITSSVIRAGGPLSGFQLTDLQAPVVATTNCLSMDTPAAAQAVRDCIRCGACSDVCPVDLLPQQLYWHATHEDSSALQRQGLDRCLRCGCCDLVCPSHIPLTDLFRHATSMVRAGRHTQALSERAELRHTVHIQRDESRAAARAASRQAAVAERAAGVDPVAAAVERARQRKQASQPPTGKTGVSSVDQPGTGPEREQP